VVVVLMVEKHGAVEHLEEILSLGGIDMVQWGPNDYSMSIGKPGTWPNPELRAVERRVIETCLGAGVPPRAEIYSVDAAQYYLDLGVRHFRIGTDLSILYGWLKKNGEALRKTIEAA
jgi:2-keto-3-deoxy-L-rhamnonate aldolase RhmA